MGTVQHRANVVAPGVLRSVVRLKHGLAFRMKSQCVFGSLCCVAAGEPELHGCSCFRYATKLVTTWIESDRCEPGARRWVFSVSVKGLGIAGAQLSPCSVTEPRDPVPRACMRDYIYESDSAAFFQRAEPLELPQVGE